MCQDRRNLLVPIVDGDMSVESIPRRLVEEWWQSSPGLEGDRGRSYEEALAVEFHLNRSYFMPYGSDLLRFYKPAARGPASPRRRYRG